MVEFLAQKRFFDCITKGEKCVTNDGTDIYAELIYNRFDDVFSTTFPLLKSIVSSKEWCFAIEAFIASKPKTAYIWQLPLEFEKFILKKKLLEQPCLKELLWFECSKIKSAVSPKDSLSANGAYKVSNSVFMKTLKHKVHANEPHTQGAFPVLIFCDVNDSEVYYYETTQHIFYFLSGLKSGKTPQILASDIAKKLKADEEEVFELLSDALQKFLVHGIVICG